MDNEEPQFESVDQMMKQYFDEAPVFAEKLARQLVAELQAQGVHVDQAMVDEIARHLEEKSRVQLTLLGATIERDMIISSGEQLH